MSSTLFGDLTNWVQDIMESLGYVGIAFLIALENLIPPIPSEIVLPLAGFMVGQGRFTIVPVVLAATLGSLIGAVMLYGIGYWLGERRLRWLVRRYGRWLLLDESDLDKAYNQFQTHGTKAVFFGRLLPVVRSLISIPAGVTGMPMPRFMVYTTIGSTIWNSTLIGFGWILGNEWHRVEVYTGYLQYVVLAAILAGGLYFVWKRRSRVFG